MGRLDELKDKAKGLVSENRDKIEQGLEKAGDMINQKTGGKHEDKIDKGLAKAKDGLDKVAPVDEGPAADTTGAAASPDPAHPAAPPTASLDGESTTGSSGPPGTPGASGL